MLWTTTEVSSSDEKKPADWKRVHEASQAKMYGVHIPARKGKAVVYWNMSQDHTVDPRTWHGEGRVQPGGGGSMILEKIKEMPAERRKIHGAIADRGWKVGGEGDVKEMPERTIDDVWNETIKQVP